MLTVLFAASDANWAEYAAPLRHAISDAGLTATLTREADPAAVDYIIYAPSSPLQDFAPFTRCKAVLSLWAGVERIVGNASLTQPLCRMVDPGLTEGMVEWVVGHTLRHHLGMDRHIVNPARIWDPTCPPLARERPVAMLGMGELGRACTRALTALNFPVTGWSRTPKDIPGIPCLHGEDGLEQALRGAQRLLDKVKVRCKSLLLSGDPAERIANHARGSHCSLIVMGSHGRGGMTGLLLGSVAQKTLAEGRTPVLIVR